MIVVVIILSSAPPQQGCSIFMTTSPSFNEHPSYFLVQNAVGTLGHVVSQPWPSHAKYSLLLEFARCPRLLLSPPTGFGSLWKRRTLIQPSCIPLFTVISCVQIGALIEFVASVLFKVVARVDVDCIYRMQLLQVVDLLAGLLAVLFNRIC